MINNINQSQRENRIVDYIERKTKLQGAVGFGEIVKTFGAGRFKIVRKELMVLQRKGRIEVSPQGGFRTKKVV